MSEQAVSEKPLIESVEQACCPACDAVIARNHVFINMHPHPGTLKRTVKAYCQHCNRGWIANQKLRGASWCDEQSGATSKELTGRDLEGLKARVDHVDGTRRVEALSA